MSDIEKKEIHEESSAQEKRRGGRGRGRGRGRGKGRGRGRGGIQNPDKSGPYVNRREPKEGVDKDSYYYKLNFGPWPKQDRIEVTIDSELPDIKPKDERLVKPSQDDHRKVLDQETEKIEALYQKIKDIYKEKDERVKTKIDAAKAEALKERSPEEQEQADKEKSDHDIFDDLKKKRAELFVIREEKDAIVEKANAEKTKFVEEERYIMKNISQKYKSEKGVSERLDDIDTTLTTTSVSSAVERDLIKEKAFLKKSVDYVKRMDEMSKRRDEIKATLKDDLKVLKKAKKDIYNLNIKINELRDIFKAEREARQELKTEHSALNDTIDEIRKQIGKLKEGKAAINEEFCKAKYLFEIENQEVRNVEFAHKRLEKLQKDREWDLKREEEAKAELAARPNPYIEEVENCDFLARYCRKIKRDHDKKLHETDIEEIKKETGNLRNEELSKQEQDGRIIVHAKKTEQEGTQFGKKKQKKQKKKKNQEVVQEKSESDPNKLSFNLELLRTFASVRIQTPDKYDELESAIQKLEQQAADFEQRGFDELDEQIKEVGKKDQGDEKPKKHQKAEAPVHKENYNGEDDSAFPTL